MVPAPGHLPCTAGAPTVSPNPQLPLTRLTWRRARDARIAQVAGSLSFTTVLAIVPLLAVSFALLSRFAVFQRFERAIEEIALAALLPPEIAQAVLKTLAQFAANAHGLTLVGALFTLASALALLLTVENALNQIWGVRRTRPLARRICVYLVLLALGPPVLGASLWATSYALSASHGLIGTLPGWLRVVLTGAPVLLGALVLAALYRLVPNTRVRRRDALVGGLLASIAFELGKRGFAAFVLQVPTYRTVYGAFATFPVFLLWVYYSWLVTLTAALLTANLGGGAKGKPQR